MKKQKYDIPALKKRILSNLIILSQTLKKEGITFSDESLTSVYYLESDLELLQSVTVKSDLPMEEFKILLKDLDTYISKWQKFQKYIAFERTI
jgi:hypothetical protein